MKVENGQQNEIIAQVGALVRSSKSPLARPVSARWCMGGTSMSAGTLINYLPAHMVFRTPEMSRIFDGFMPTSNGSTIREIDVPLIQMPTMHEVETNVTRRQDGDEPGKQYRLYEFAAIGHVDSRDNARLLPNPCTKPLSTFLTQAYFSVTLHHLLRWVDEGIVPPRAPRILLDRDESNDGSTMVLDAHGNPLGGIRSPYVDVPTAKYAPVNTAADPVIANPSEYVRVNGLARRADHVPLERLSGTVLRRRSCASSTAASASTCASSRHGSTSSSAKAGRCPSIATRSWPTSRRRSSSGPAANCRFSARA